VPGQHGQGRWRSAHLCEAILTALPIGVVAFGHDLKVIDSNEMARRLISLSDYIDLSLTAGTDVKIWRDWKAELKRAISTQQPCHFDNVAYSTTEKTKLLSIVCVPLKDSGDELCGTILIEDTTEKVHIQRALANSERLAAVGKLAAKVAHELNNPMDGILRYLGLAIRIVEHEHLEKPLDYLHQCHKGLTRMVHIISELLEFSRSAYATFEHMEVETIIDEAIKANEDKASSASIVIIRDYGTNRVKIRSGNLFQVFCNLIKNAIDVMPEGGELTISTQRSSREALVAEFRDTGPGLAPEHIERAFEPFFTTKTGGKGTGLGLAICKDIIEKYDGKITAHNAPGGGCVFTVHLPISS
ncbi:MAG: ATP-binding protein, partial [Sedimentisphaerales bacterium]|nr:ATP-binding protein [Sedimentisphaerales bacterium]